jgi:hypothetical protein
MSRMTDDRGEIEVNWHLNELMDWLEVLLGDQKMRMRMSMKIFMEGLNIREDSSRERSEV